jgi:hypothetical protein
MRESAWRAVVAAFGMLAIMSGVGGADLLGQAHADPPWCFVNGEDRCEDPPGPPHIEVHCEGAGSKWGGHCFQRWVR